MKVFRTYAEVEPYIVACQLGADAHRDALGFLPVGAYQQAAQQGKLLVAATDDRKFLGHLLFGGVFPHLKVMQIFCDEKHRNRGVSTKLINELFSYATERGFLSISAKVASDLVGAKRFYESVGFREASYLKGGKTRNRTICRFVKELDTPSLFDFLENSASGAVPSLNLAGAYKNKTPIYAIDLNVLFDFSKGRQRKKEAEALFRAGLRGEICPVITEEFSIELSRNSYGLEDDIIYKFSKLFSSIPSYGSKKTNEIRENLLRIVFGERYVSGRNTKQDYSDVNHLAQSILNNVDGFVTSEKSILRKRDDIKEIYGLDIIGLSDFEDLYDEGLIYDEPSKSININSGRLNIKSIDWDDCKGVREFLSGMNIPNQVVEDNISRENCLSSRKLWAWEKDGAIIGIYSIRSHGGPNSFFDSFICVDEAFPDSNTVIDCILNSICMFAGRSGPSLIELNIVPGHYSTRQACLAYGFRPEAGADKFAKKFHKVALGKVVSKRNWDKVRRQLDAISGVKLPLNVPNFESFSQLIRVSLPSGEEKKIPLGEIEDLLSPALFFLPGRSAAIVPIKKIFSDDLLGSADQLSLLSPPEASMLRARVYYSKPANSFEAGTPLIFYESGKAGGRKGAVAVGRAVDVRILTPDQLRLDRTTSKRGVLNPTEITLLGKAERKLVTVIDNILNMQKCVSFNRLCELGCNNGANFVTVTNVQHDKALRVIQEGFKYE